MYHAFVFVNGEWISAGLHVPSYTWTMFFTDLRELYGLHSVAYSFWVLERSVSTLDDVQARMEEDVELANEVQAKYDKSSEFMKQDGNIDLGYGISVLRTRRLRYAHI